MPHGELAALATALLWSVTTLLFTAAAERIGSLALNVIRITIALPLIAAMHVLLYGAVTFDVSREQILYLAGSGLAGLVLGDVFYFRAMVLIGPKRAALMMTCWPGIAAVIAWLWLGETLTAYALAGMGVTLAGIALAISGRRAAVDAPVHGALGLLFGLIGAFGQALGLVLAKRGLVGMEHELSGSMIRMATACAAVWTLAAFQSVTGAAQGKVTLGEAVKNRAAMAFATAGAFTGPLLGVWMSLYAANHAQVSVVATIMSTTPIWLIPLAYLFRREKPGLLELLGTLVAVSGVALLVTQR